jgi:hypothetical protein
MIVRPIVRPSRFGGSAIFTRLLPLRLASFTLVLPIMRVFIRLLNPDETLSRHEFYSCLQAVINFTVATRKMSHAISKDIACLEATRFRGNRRLVPRFLVAT